jgi:hypothetical protein
VTGAASGTRISPAATAATVWFQRRLSSAAQTSAHTTPTGTATTYAKPRSSARAPAATSPTVMTTAGTASARQGR